MKSFLSRRETRLWLQKYWIFALAGGALFGSLGTELPLEPWSAVGLALALAIWGCAWLNRCAGEMGLVLAIALAGALWCYGWGRWQSCVRAARPLAPWVQGDVVLSGYFCERPRYRSGKSQGIFYVETVRSPDGGAGDRVILNPAVPVWMNWRGNWAPRCGELVRTSGKIREICAEEEGFAQYCSRLGIHESLRVFYMEAIPEQSAPLSRKWYRFSEDIRGHLEDKARAGLTEEKSAIFLAMALGRSSLLDDKTLERFRRIGVAHMLAASGLHLGLVLGAVLGMVRWAGFSRRHGVLMGGVGILLYAALVGFTPSMVRALLMSYVALGAIRWGRPYNLGRAWALVLALALLVHPGQIFQAGFQLSYAAVWGIAMFFVPLQSLITMRLARWGMSCLNWLGKSLALTGAVALAVTPLSLYNFGQASYLGALTNLILVPLLEFALGAGLLAWCLPLSLSRTVWKLCGLLLELSQREALLLERWAGSGQFAELPAICILMYFMLLLSVWLALRSRAHHTNTIGT